MTPKFNNEYNIWKSGKNYMNKSKNKIKIKGTLHKELGKKFRLHNIPFNEIDKKNWGEYHLETTKINKKIDIRNIERDKENKIINEEREKTLEYNKKVHEIINQIKKLENWNDSVLFEEVKYGIPSIFNCIHRENDCNGLLEKSKYESCQCHCCEDWGGCSNPIGTQYYKCNKCGYEYSESKSSGGYNYKGK